MLLKLRTEQSTHRAAIFEKLDPTKTQDAYFPVLSGFDIVTKLHFKQVRKVQKSLRCSQSNAAFP